MKEPEHFPPEAYGRIGSQQDPMVRVAERAAQNASLSKFRNGPRV